MDDRLLAECAAARDDDQPRLIWADAAGDERGELVVVQCELARSPTTIDQLVALRRRERALLWHFHRAWADGIDGVARRWRFRRGFIEAARIPGERFASRDLARWPLLHSLTLVAPRSDRLANEADYLTTLRAIGLTGSEREVLGALEVLARSELPAVRALAFDDVGRSSFDLVRQIATKQPRLEQLQVSGFSTEPSRLVELLAALPALATLVVDGWSLPGALIGGIPLRSYRGSLSDVDWLRGSTLLRSLEQLHLTSDLAAVTRMVDCPRLTTLDLDGPLSRTTIGALASLTLPSLRRLALPEGITARDASVIAERFGSRLHELTLPQPRDRDEQRVWREIAALVPGEVRLTPPLACKRLGRAPLHGALAADFEPEVGLTANAADALTLIGRSHEQTIEIPPFASSERIIVGRGPHADLVVVDSTVADRHLAVGWDGAHHTISEVDATSGPQPLRDGDRLAFGAAEFEYRRGQLSRASTIPTRLH